MIDKEPEGGGKRVLDKRLRLVAAYCRIHKLPSTGPHVDALMQMSDEQFERMVMGGSEAKGGEA